MLGRVRVSSTSDSKALPVSASTQPYVLPPIPILRPGPGMKHEGRKAFLSLTLFHLWLFLYQIWILQSDDPTTLFTRLRLVSLPPPHGVKVLLCFVLVCFAFKATISDLGEFMLFGAPLPLIFSFLPLLPCLSLLQASVLLLIIAVA